MSKHKKNHKTYNCPRCKKSFPKKYNLDKHLEKQDKCKKTKGPEEPGKEYKCECGNSYGRSDYLKNHMAKCKVIKEKNRHQEIDKTDNISIPKIDHPSLYPYNLNTEIRSLTYREYRILTQTETDIIPCLFKFMYFSPFRPQCHSIHYLVDDPNHILVFNGLQWNKKSIDKIFSEILNICITLLRQYVVDSAVFLEMSIKERITDCANSIDPKCIISKQDGRIYQQTSSQLHKKMRLIATEYGFLSEKTYQRTNKTLSTSGSLSDSDTESQSQSDSSSESSSNSVSGFCSGSFSDALFVSPSDKEIIKSNSFVSEFCSGSFSDALFDSSSDKEIIESNNFVPEFCSGSFSDASVDSSSDKETIKSHKMKLKIQAIRI
jgi:hypothetical protein